MPYRVLLLIAVAVLAYLVIPRGPGETTWAESLTIGSGILLGLDVVRWWRRAPRASLPFALIALLLVFLCAAALTAMADVF
jgi:hypothetical protein